MTERVQVGGLGVAASLHRFIEEEALPGAGVDPQAFWDGADAVIHDLAPRNRELLARRDELQAPHRRLPPRAPRACPTREAYTAFLREIGYLLDEPADFAVTTDDVDDEVARDRRPAAGRAAAQRALRDERRRTPAGGRSTTRSTAPT